MTNPIAFQLVDPASHRSKLSGRELECLGLAAQGLTTREIAAELGISARTVQFHVGRLCEKLRVANRRAAIAVAVRDELLGPIVAHARIPSKRNGDVDLTRSPSATRAAPRPSAPSRAG